jgi:UDP-xylose/UDP-N-acetylglucosamine transporter B4
MDAISALTSWAATLSLVFGGCCANALTLEQLTLTYPNFGTLITFLQFLLIALHGLPGHVYWTRTGPRLKPRRIHIGPYVGQVVLFYGISMLNNWAFGYNIPMPVHIIFRSGGLVVSMLFGWLISKKRCVQTSSFFGTLLTRDRIDTISSKSSP